MTEEKKPEVKAIPPGQIMLEFRLYLDTKKDGEIGIRYNGPVDLEALSLCHPTNKTRFLADVTEELIKAVLNDIKTAYPEEYEAHFKTEASLIVMPKMGDKIQ